MRAGTHAAALLVAAALVAAGGCSGGDTTTAARPPAPDGSGYFVGTGADGLGAAVDLLADDPVTRRGRAALARAASGTGHPAPAVGLVSLVNDGDRPQPFPRFIAVMDGGGAVPMPGARGPASGLEHPAGVFPSPPLFVRAGGTATAYVLLAGVRPQEVDHLKMVVRPGEPVTLEARRR